MFHPIYHPLHQYDPSSTPTHEFWLPKWLESIDEAKRLYVAGFIGGYKEQIEELRKKHEKR